MVLASCLGISETIIRFLSKGFVRKLTQRPNSDNVISQHIFSRSCWDWKPSAFYSLVGALLDECIFSLFGDSNLELGLMFPQMPYFIPNQLLNLKSVA